MIRHSLPRAAYNKWTEIDQQALIHNLNCLRQACSGQKLMGVVKANAYGHNVSLVAPVLAEQGVSHFGVATLAEAYYLQALCPQAEMVLLLGALHPDQFGYALEADLDLLLHTPEHVVLLEALAARLGKKARLHLKLDTGMGRVGMLPEQLEATLEALQNTRWLELRGICSHLATSDRPDDPHVRLQISRFQAAQQLFQSHTLAQRFQPLFHLANSDAVLQYPDSHFDMVRPGIALYGYSGIGHPQLQPVLALKGLITQIKDLPAGWSVGYGQLFTTQRPTRLGVLALGYADGVNRLLSNRLDVVIAGQRAPLVGRISMDQVTVDLSDLPADIQPGTEVLLLGSAAGALNAQDWAERLDSIPYEVLTSLGTRLPRYSTAEPRTEHAST